MLEGSVKRAQSIVGFSKTRSQHDFYTTPAYATEALLSVEELVGNVWEPACGNGAISKVLEAHGIEVVSTDLIDRGYGSPGRDFFKETMIHDNIITNPPYSLGQQFVEHALAHSRRKVAMLVKVNFLEGVSRRKMFETTPFARVHVFSKRVTQLKDDKPLENGGMMCFAWFVWEHGYTGKATIDWL